MWELLLEITETYGLPALVAAAETCLLVYLFRVLRQKDEQLSKCNVALQELANKRLEDFKESNEDYEDLSRDFTRSLDMLIKILSK